MPLNRALDFLKSDYHSYISNLKRNVTKKADDSFDSDNAENASDESDDERRERKSGRGSASSKIFKFNRKHKKFLKLLLKPILSDGERSSSIKLNDMDRLLTYLSKQKSNLINATLTPSKSDEPVPDSKAANPSQPVALLSMQINPAEAAVYSQQHVQVAQIPSLLSMPYQMPPPLLNQSAGLASSLLMQQFHLIPNYGMGLAGANPGGMGLLGQYPLTLSSMSTPPPSMSTAPPSLMSIQPNQTSGANAPASTAPSLMSVQPSSLMNLSLPNYQPLSNNSSPSNSLLGNPPPGIASYPKATNSSNPGSNNFKQQQR